MELRVLCGETKKTQKSLLHPTSQNHYFRFKKRKPKPLMAKNNEVMAKVRITVGGVEASKKNLNALQTSASELSAKLKELTKQKVKFVDENDVKAADAVVKEMNKVTSALKLTQQMIKTQEAELNNYANILDDLAGTRLNHLQKGLRDLQAQMKQTLTLNDVKRYGELKAAYDQLLSGIEQLSGKVPNLSYVLKNLGQVADKTLSDSIAYTEKLIATTDKTTKRGRDNIKAWTSDLKKMREEMATRSIKVLDNPQHYSVEAIQQSVAALKKLQPALKLSQDEWDKYAKKIKGAEEYLKSYEEKQKKLEELAVRKKTDSVLKNPAGFSQQEVEDAIKAAEKLQKTYKVGSPWWKHYKDGIDAAKLSLDSFNQKQKEVDEQARKKTTAKILNDPTATGISEQAILDAIKHGKELQKELEYGSDKWKTYATQIKNAEEYLKSYDVEQRRLMETQKAQAAITAAATAKKADGSFNLTKEEAKAAAEAIEKYINTLNMSTQAKEIKEATDALNVYNEALGKVKESSIDVGAVLKDPSKFSTEQIEKAIKQLEDAGKAIDIGKKADIQKNVEDINKLRAALAESKYNGTWIQKVVDDSEKGKASIQDMEKAIADIKEKMKRTTDKTVMEKLRRDLDVLNPRLDETRTNMTRVATTLGNIKGSNLGSLKEAAERLKAEINDVNLKMDDFATKAAQLKKVNAQIKELESQTKDVASAWDNAVSRLKNFVLIYAGSSEIWNRVKQGYQDSLRLSDAMTDVQKTTGLAKEEIRRLTDEIQELDTRITNEKLMQAATEAGRIGLKTRKEVLEFTRASAITLTALDELDARSITAVMKLNTLLGETARLGVQQAILSTASSINELSMTSAAAQQPIIDFSRRFGGIAAQANISTAQVLGLGATIDALGQPIEMSSTALNKFTTALLSNGKAIAKDTGLSEEYIFDMIRQKKTIELMIEVLGKLNNLGGIGEISKYMGDMGGDGARMTAVISALAANLGFLQENLDLSNRSFEEGVSVMNEYNLKNENAMALVQRMANEVKEYFVNSTTVKVLTGFLSVLQSVIHFMLSGTVAAKAFNSVLILIITRMMTMNKTVKSLNVSLMTHSSMLLKGALDWRSLSSAMTAARAGVVALGASLKALFLSNPLGWVAVGVSLLWDFIGALIGTSEKTEDLKSAIERANESFEAEAYKLRKLKDSLDATKDSANGFSAIISTLNRDYGKQIGYVLDLAAGYKEVAGAIELATAAKRKQVLQDEKDKNFQNVQEEFRERQTNLLNSLKEDIGLRGEWGQFRFMSKKAQQDLYAAIAQDLNTSAALSGEAKIGAQTEQVLRAQAKVMAETYYRTVEGFTDLQLKDFDTSAKEQELYESLKKRVENLSSVEDLGDVYVEKIKVLNDLNEEVDRQLVTQTKVENELLQNQIDLLDKENDLANKAAKDYTADDEHTLSSIISLYQEMLLNMDKDTDFQKWSEISEHVSELKNRQREVMLAFVENPLRGIKMKVGEDGKLYKEVLANGKYQYEFVQNMSDANLEVLRRTYVRTGKVFDQLMSDYNQKMDSRVKEQALQLAAVRTAINTELKKNGLDIDEEGNLKLRDTEYRDGTEREEDKEARAAYKALLDNMEEYYGKRKEILLKRLLDEGKTIKEKNLELKKWEVEYRQGLVDMQSELLGQGESFDEKLFIRDIEQYKRAAQLVQNASKTFMDKVANDLQKNKNKILDLQFLPAEKGGRNALDKKLRESYTAILKNIEEYYAKQRQLVEADYLNSTITVEEKNRRLEDIELQHWQTRISMQQEVLGELGENGEKVDWFNEEAIPIRDLEGYKFVVDHMLDETHHFQDTVRADMENTVKNQSELLSKNKRKVDEILLGNNYQAQVDKEMQEAFETTGLFWGEMQDRTAENAVKITAAIREASMDAYTSDEAGYRERLEANKVFGDTVKNMTEEQFAAYLILLREFRMKSVDAEKKRLDDLKKLLESWMEETGIDDAYKAADRLIGLRESEHSFMSSNDAYANKHDAFEQEQRLILQRVALDEWYFNTKLEWAKKQANAEELISEIQLEQMEKRNEHQMALVENYTTRLQQMADMTNTYGSLIGEGFAKLAMGEKDAGKELIKNLLNETIQMSAEFAKRLIMEQTFGQAMRNIKQTQYAQQAEAAYTAAMTEVGIEASKMEAIQGIATGEITIQSLKQLDSILTFGKTGMARAALLIGMVTAASAAAMAIVNSLFGGSASKAESASSKRLATGMMTYAEGRYPVQGNDGVTYNAQYEPSLQTRVYDGGRGKAHMALFSEVLPEMVVSGPTTRIIQEDYPALMNAIMTIDKYGSLPQPRRMRRYANGNMDEFDADLIQTTDGSFVESQAITELRQSNNELRETVAQLAAILEKGIHANINMYGTGGIKESMTKADKFYAKNRIKSS